MSKNRLRLSGLNQKPVRYYQLLEIWQALLFLPGLVEAWGFEPQTYSLQSYRSTN